MEGFQKELEQLINRHSLENESDTPDFILAQFIKDSLNAFNIAVKERSRWYGQEKQLSERLKLNEPLK